MKFLLAIACGGVLAGSFDIAYAILAWGANGVPATRILQSIASGVLGHDAYVGGTATATLGLALHFLIAIGMATGFVVLSSAFPIMLRRALASGVVYGLILFLIMNYVVMPISAIHRFGSPQGWMLVGALFAHTVLVGTPIALSARTFLRGPR